MVTRAGRFALAAGIALLVTAAVTDWIELGYAGLALLLALAAALPIVLARPRIEVDRSIEPVRVTVGSPSLGVLSVENRSPRPVGAVLAEDSVGGGFLPVPLPGLAPGATAVTRYLLPTDRRAVLQVGPLSVVRRDPFGFVRHEQRRGGQETLWVHPRHHLLRGLPTSLVRSTDGPTSDSAPQGTVSFHTIREYVPGDDRRLIHWRTTARVGKLMVKQHVDTTLPDLTIVVDTRSDRMGEEPFEEAMEMAASLVCTCTADRYPVTIRTTCGSVFKVQRNEAPRQFFLDRLAGLDRSDSGDLAKVVRDLGLGTPGVNLAVITAGASDAELEGVVSLRRRFRAIVVADVTTTPGNARVFHRPGMVKIEAATGAEFAEMWNRATR